LTVEASDCAHLIREPPHRNFSPRAKVEHLTDTDLRHCETRQIGFDVVVYVEQVALSCQQAD
jgi:hypothetical protein